MSKLETVVKKRALLTVEKQAILAERLKGIMAVAEMSGQPSLSSKNLLAMLEQWTEQEPLDVDWDVLVEAGRRQSLQLPTNVDFEVVPRLFQAINQITVGYVCAAFRQMGAFAGEGSRCSVDDLVNRFDVKPEYRKLMSRWLGMLADEGLLSRDGSDFVSASPLPANGTSDALRAFESDENFNEYSGVVKLMRANGQNLCGLVSGKKLALETFFSGGAADLPELVYHGAPHARYFNHIVTEILEEMAQRLSPRRELRILELGAGVGGTTTSLLPVLPPYDTVYVFTDISSYFVRNAERKYEKYPFVFCHLLDIDHDPLALGYQPHSFDVVIAANVIHCASRLRETLDHIRSLLSSGGLLILIELTRSENWHNIMMGLLTGFLNYDDERLEANDPLLTCSQWKDVLEATGFERTEIFPESDSPAAVLGQHVILARSS